jgi:hypothetical protein
MSMRRTAALLAGLMLVSMCANAASRNNTIRITVLDSQTRALNLDNNGVPNNCDQLTFDAYCRSTTNAPLVNTLLVQEGNEPPFRVTCTMESRNSKCVPLPKGETLDARRGKHGITVYYVDDKGKVRGQFYKLVDSNEKTGPPATAVAVAAQRAPAAAKNAGQAPAAPVPNAAAPAQNSATSAAAPPPAPAQSGLAEKTLSEKVKCNFSSTPSGAEITIDWRYVGNTPSEIGLSPGTHVVAISLPGFAEWKRELTVEANSAVNVTATLQKTQP